MVAYIKTQQWKKERLRGERGDQVTRVLVKILTLFECYSDIIISLLQFVLYNCAIVLRFILLCKNQVYN